MGIQVFNGLLRDFPPVDATAIIKGVKGINSKSFDVFFKVCSVASPIISQLSYLQIGVGIVTIGAILIYRDLKALDNEIQKKQETNRNDSIAYALPLMRDDMDEADKAEILDAIASIPKEERNDVLVRALSLMSDDMNGSNIACILSTIGHIPAEKRDDVVARALLLMSDDDSDDDTYGVNEIWLDRWVVEVETYRLIGGRLGGYEEML